MRTPFAVLGAALALAGSAAAPAAAAPLAFAPPITLSDQLAGGEPVLLTDPVHHTIVYSSHEGTTHIYKAGFASQTTFTFLTGYRNQVNNWVSSDGGKTFKFVDVSGTGFTQPPPQNTGFSDPDLTQDAGGRIYNTGINLANDSLFSSNDGGKTWDQGTAACHDGDRPWLSGVGKDQVFMVTNTAETTLSARVFESTDGGRSCSTSSRDVFGDTSGGESWTGNGKMIYDRVHDQLVMPTDFSKDNVAGIGVATAKSKSGAFVAHRVASVPGGIYAHWSSVAVDDAGGLFLTWDDNPVQQGSNTGCEDAPAPLGQAGPTPAPNTIHLAYSPDGGATWNTPVVIAAPANARVLWPWVVAGEQGNASVVWYQTNKVVDLACQNADMSIQAANVLGGDTAAPRVSTADPIGRPISKDGNICQSGTTCVATGEDRRLGDFFTNGIDERGCVLVASGDTTSPDPLSGGIRPVALPIFTRQTSGPALRGGGDCSGEQASLGLPASSSGTAPGAGGTGAANGASSGTAAKSCVSRRSFRIRLRAPKGEKLRSAKIYVAGKRKLSLSGKKLSAPVSLTGLPKGIFTVRVQAVGASGKRYVDLRTYRTCAEKRKPKAKKHTLKPKKRG
jgi:hypothetical protein